MCFDSLNYYIENSEEFWEYYDKYYDFICNQTNLYVIPSLGAGQTPKWYELDNVNPTETLNEFITNKSSVSRQTMSAYIKEYITRYKSRKCILFWEMGNELNLFADLPNRNATDTFSTPEMVEFTSNVVSIIQNIDNIRPISSGYSCTRPNAYHLYYNKSFDIDTIDEWSYMLSWQNKYFDIISCHSYGNENFFNQGIMGTQQYYVASNIAYNESKMFYLGEFGPLNVNYSNTTDTQYVYSSINSMIDVYNNTDSVWYLSTIWAWEDYSHGNTLLYPNRTTSIPVLNSMKLANQFLFC